MLDGMLEDTQVPPLEGVSQKLDSFDRDLLAVMGLQAPTSAAL